MARARRLLADRDDPRLLADLELLGDRSSPPPAAPPGPEVHEEGAEAQGHPSRFRRDNAADPSLMGDLERLAGAPASAGAATVTGATAPARRQPAMVRHARRYVVYYALALGAVLIVSLRQPVPVPVAASDAFAAPSPATPALARPGVPANQGVQAAVGPSYAGSPQLVAPTPAPAAPAVAPQDQLPPIIAFPAEPEAPASVPLRIVDSGYASATGGTPLEQDPPGGGLPVALAGGTTTKLSFIRLDGSANLLHLSLVADPTATVNDSSAAVSACRITTAAWAAGRGIPLGQAPPYDATDCVTGKRQADGSYTFDLSRPDRASPNGFALVPGAGANGAFQVTFAPKATA